MKTATTSPPLGTARAAVWAAALLALACGPAPAPAGAQAAAGPETKTFGIAHAAPVEPGVLAAGQPTADQLRQAAAAGFRTVLDLRAPAEDRGFDEAAAARELGLAYVNLPVVPAELDGATLDRFVRAFEAAERPVLLHCGTSNRVGGMLFAYLMLAEGLGEEQALERARAAGLASPELTAQVRALVRARKAQ